LPLFPRSVRCHNKNGEGFFGASFAGELVGWITSGVVVLSPRDIYRLRVAGLVVAPSLAGLILALGLALGTRPR